MKLQARIDRVVQKGNVKAIASVSLDGMFVVKGLKVMDGNSVAIPCVEFVMGGIAKAIAIENENWRRRRRVCWSVTAFPLAA